MLRIALVTTTYLPPDDDEWDYCPESGSGSIFRRPTVDNPDRIVFVGIVICAAVLSALIASGIIQL